MSMSPPPPPPPGPPPIPTPGWGAAPPPGYPTSYPAQPAAGGQLAGFGSRLGGMILDSILYGILAAVFTVPGIIMIATSLQDCVTVDLGDNRTDVVCPPGSPNGGLLGGGIALIALGLIVVAVLYVRALGKTGQTWGRKLANVKVVGKATGQPIGFGRALGRTLFAQIISGAICYLGYLWMLWDTDKQTWHDKVVDSVVVKA